jgi:outer membrane autotransporter protein
VLRHAVLLIVSLGCLVASASGQREARHRGFWISPALGYAATFSDPLYEEAGVSQETGFAIGVRLGGTVSQQVLLGGEIVGWGAGSSIFRGSLMFTALYYPTDKGGLFVDAAVGTASRSVSYTAFIAGGTVVELEETSNGIALSAGLGYDLQVASNFFITPRVQGTLHYLKDHWAPAVIALVGFTWH